MKVLVDLNVLLDVTLNRPEFVRDSALAFGRLVSTRNGQCYLAQHAVTTLFYILRKQCGVDCARLTVKRVLKIFKVIPASRQVLMDAADSQYADYEDAVTFLSAAASGCDLILTRNPRDFAKSPVPVKTPHAFLQALA